MNSNTELSFVCIIARHGDGNHIVEACGKKLNFCHIALGHGTADSNLIDLLGLSDVTDKDVIFATSTKEDFHAVKKILLERFHFEDSGKGVAFTVPIESVGGNVTLQLLSGKHHIAK